MVWALGGSRVAVATALECQTLWDYNPRPALPSFFLSFLSSPLPSPLFFYLPFFNMRGKTILTIYYKMGILSLEHLITLITLQGRYNCFYFIDDETEI